MTCKDCVHFDLCVELNAYDGEDIVDCEFFKDRSKFVELPCKAGDYLFESAFGQITEFEVIGFEFASFRPEYIYIEIENKVNRFVTGTFAFNIGKTVFLTKEEAERALEGI